MDIKMEGRTVRIEGKELTVILRERDLEQEPTGEPESQDDKGEEKQLCAFEGWDQLKIMEANILAGLILDSRAHDSVFSVLDFSDFGSIDHMVIYTAIKELWEENTNVDIVLLSDKLKEKGHLDAVGGEDYLMFIMENCEHPELATKYADGFLDVVKKRKTGETKKIREGKNET